MESKRNSLAVIITMMIVVLLFNINDVLGQESSSAPALLELPVLKATFEASKDTFVTGVNGNMDCFSCYTKLIEQLGRYLLK